MMNIKQKERVWYFLMGRGVTVVRAFPAIALDISVATTE